MKWPKIIEAIHQGYHTYPLIATWSERSQSQVKQALEDMKKEGIIIEQEGKYFMNNKVKV
ncbi:MAG: hypothetical protein AAFP08_03225 [Bacteroidota bacterium]